jgi:hypothetical protein
MTDDILDQLAEAVEAEVQAAGVPPGGLPSHPPSFTGIQKVKYSHEAMINLLISRQGKISQNELAAVFDRSPSWISQIMSSDAFQARLMERTKELVDPGIVASVEEQLKGQLSRSMEILREKLDRPIADIPDNLVLRTLELSSRALGYGTDNRTTNVQVNVNNHLEDLGGRLTDLLARKKAEVGVVIPGESASYRPTLTPDEPSSNPELKLLEEAS